MRLYYLEDTHDWQFDGSRRAVLDVGLVDVISDARAAAAQHKQWRAQQTGGGIASRQQLHARTNGGNGRARIHSSCSSGGGGGSFSCHRPPHHWRRGAARSASRLTPADWAHAPRGAAGDLICSNPP